VLGVLWLALGAGAATAQTTIDTFPAWDGESYVHSFGAQNNTPTYGQTLVAPAGTSSLTSFSFQIDGGAGLSVRGEVYAWDGEAGRATGSALYESAPRVLSEGVQTVTFTTGGVPVVPGERYVIFATTLRDQQPSEAGSARWASVAGETYSAGTFVFSNDSTFESMIGSAWDGWTQYDLAFRAVFDGGASAGRPTVTRVSPARGSTDGGDTVMIEGAGFAPAWNVFFGDRPAKSFTVLDYSHIVAVTPAHVARTVDVTVVGPGGTSELVRGDAFTFVTPTPEPAAPSADPSCNVPNLKGRTVTKARVLLARAGCKLGAVVRHGKPRPGRKRMRITRQGPEAGAKLSGGSAVWVVLAPVADAGRK
jgi:hypothetical protein